MYPKTKINSDEFKLFLTELNVTKDISFNDDVWDFFQEDNPLLFHIDRSKVRIAWKDFYGSLPEQMIYEVRQLALIYFRRKDIVAYRREVSDHGFKDYYICGIMVKFLKYLAIIFKNSLVDFGTSLTLKDSHIVSLFDLTVDDLRFGIENFPETGMPSVKGILKNLCSPEVKDEIDQSSATPKSIKWNSKDIKNLKLQISNDDGVLKIPKVRYLDDNVLRLLISRSTEIIQTFCSEYGIVDKSSISGVDNSSLQIFYDLKSIRETGDRKLRYKFQKTYGMSGGDFARKLADVQLAAFYLVFQFTGARYSEAIHFTTSNMKLLDTGYWVLKGPVIKNRAHESITDNDYWVITNVTFKAVLALEAINIVYDIDYLLAPSIRTKPKRGNKPIKNNTVTTQLKLFFKKCDSKGEFYDLVSGKLLDKKFIVSTHRIRHTLTREMIRCNLSMAQISYHFKHVYIGHLFLKKTSNVTLGYGGLRTSIFNDAISLKTLRGDLINSFIDEHSPVSGNKGAQFKNRAIDFFKGSVDSRVNLQNASNQILNAGHGLNEIGIGFCTGVRKIAGSDDANALPSCVTHQHCNSVLCQNSFFIKSKLPNLRAMLRTYDDKLARENVSHYREYYQRFVSKLREIIVELEGNGQ